HHPVDDRDAPEAPTASCESVEQAGVVGAVAAGLDDEGSAHTVRPECLVEERQGADLVRPRAVAGALHEGEASRLEHVDVTVDDGPRHLSMLAVMPRIKRSERNAYTRTTGRIAITMPVAIIPMSSILSPMNRMIPSGSVRFSSSVTRTTAYR